MSKSVTFDSEVIRAFAAALYAQARAIVISYSIAGLLLGAVIGGACGGATKAGDATVILAGVFGLLGLWMGYKAGQAKAFALRLQAQTALCHVQIEENTRGQAQLRKAV